MTIASTLPARAGRAAALVTGIDFSEQRTIFLAVVSQETKANQRHINIAVIKWCVAASVNRLAS